MHHPIGGAGAEARGLAKRQPDDFAAASRAHDADGFGGNGAGGQPRLQPEIDQHTAGIGRELQAGAGFFQPFGLFKDNDTKSPGCQRQRRRQSSDPGARDKNRARRGHRPLRRPCPSVRIRAGGPRRRRGRRHGDTGSSNRGR